MFSTISGVQPDTAAARARAWFDALNSLQEWQSQVVFTPCSGSERSLTKARRLVQNSAAWTQHTRPGLVGMSAVAWRSQYAQEVTAAEYAVSAYLGCTTLNSGTRRQSGFTPGREEDDR